MTTTPVTTTTTVAGPHFLLARHQPAQVGFCCCSAASSDRSSCYGKRRRGRGPAAASSDQCHGGGQAVLDSHFVVLDRCCAVLAVICSQHVYRQLRQFHWLQQPSRPLVAEAASLPPVSPHPLRSPRSTPLHYRYRAHTHNHPRCCSGQT